MISVKDALTELDRQAKRIEASRQLAQQCLRSWRESLRAVENFVFPLFPGAGRAAEEDWQQVRRCIDEDAPESVIEDTPRMVERVLHNYAQRARQAQQEELESVRGVLEVVARAADSGRKRTERYSGSFRTVCASLGELAKLEDPVELRRRLTREADTLRENVSRMLQENVDSLEAMEADLRQFRERLAEAELAASTDPLTGLANRRELERQLDARISAMSPFCVLLFDLNGFKSVNDRFGHDGGDEALRQFAQVLHEQVRPGDVVARWGGDEFFVVMDCPLKDALRRSRQVSEKLARRYEITVEGNKVQIQLSASSGVVEYLAGESAAELFRRADQAMYAVKSMRPAANR